MVLNGNDMFSILAVLKKDFTFQKFWIKVNVLKTFKTFTGCQIQLYNFCTEFSKARVFPVIIIKSIEKMYYSQQYCVKLTKNAFVALIHFYHFKLLKAVNKFTISFIFFIFYIIFFTFYVIFFHSLCHFFPQSRKKRFDHNFCSQWLIYWKETVQCLREASRNCWKESETIIFNTLRIGVA